MLFHCGSFKLDLSRALVMGIVNVTPDSFYDGGRYSQCDSALVHAYQLIQEGADIIDVGGESTRPGAMLVDTQVELDRIMPIIEGLRGAPVPISVDTCKPEVMRAVLAAGVSMINDVNSLQQLDAMTAVAESGAAVCLMHRNNLPKATTLPHYQNVVEEVMQFLHLRVLSAQKAGITKNRIMIDPGFGFDKTLTDNLTILKNIDKLTTFGVPVLAGISRKSMLGEIANQNVEHRAHASVAAALLAVMRGARMVRVHDVRATVDALSIFNATEGVGL